MIASNYTTEHKSRIEPVSKKSRVGDGRDEKYRYEAKVTEQPRGVVKSLLQKVSRAPKRESTIPIFERVLDRKTSEEILLKWHKLKSLGFDVVPMLQITDQGTLISSDVTADGSETYGRISEINPQKYIGKRENGLSEVDRLFVQNFPALLEEITSKLQKIARKASKNKITLAPDDPCELIIHPDGTWSIIFLDLSSMGVDVTLPQSDVDMLNELYAKNFLSDLKKTYEEMLSINRAS